MKIPFSNILLSACQVAISKHIFNQEQFIQFVLSVVTPEHGILLETVAIDQQAPDRAKRNRELFTRIEELVKTSPRGSYCLIKQVFQNNRNMSYVFKTVMSDGTGHISNGGIFNSYSAEPSGDLVALEMLRYEIEQCRKYCEQKNYLHLCRTAIKEYDFHYGQSFKNVLIPGHSKPFTTATIVKVNFEEGSLKLVLWRGSSKRIESTISAIQFIEYAGLTDSKIPLPSISLGSSSDLFYS